MAHERSAFAEVQEIDCGGETNFNSFVEGQLYAWSHNITSLGTVRVLGIGSDSPDSPHLRVDVIYSDEGGPQLFNGLYDWASCTLVYLEDERGNKIAGEVNVDIYPWGDTNYANNEVDASSQFTPYSGLGAVSVDGNKILNGSNVDLNTLAGYSVLTFTDNLIVQSAVSFANSAGTFNVTDNVITGASSLDLEGNVTTSLLRNNISHSGITLNPAGCANVINENTIADSSIVTGGFAASHEINSSTIVNGSVVSLVAGVNTLVQKVLLNDSSINNASSNTGTPLGTITVENSNLANQSVITASAGTYGDGSWDIANLDASAGAITLTPAFTHAGTFSISKVSLIDASITVSGTGATASSIADSSFLPGSSLVHSSAGGSSNLVNVSVVDGILTTAGYDLNGAWLEGANSTLAADLTNAAKSGYINALP